MIRVVFLCLCGFDYVHLSILWRQSISVSHIPLYCTSNFSLPSLFLCLPPLSSPSPLWSFWMEAENRRERLFQSELLSRNAYIWSLTPRQGLMESQVRQCGLLWFVKRGGGGGGGGRRRGGSYAYYYACACIIISGRPTVCAHAHVKNLDAKSVRQSESDSVSFCLVMCVRQCCCWAKLAPGEEMEESVWEGEEKRQGWWWWWWWGWRGGTRGLTMTTQMHQSH